MRLALAFGLVVSAAAAFGGVWAFKYATTSSDSASVPKMAAQSVAPSGAALKSVTPAATTTTTTGQSPPPAAVRPVIPNAAAVAAPAPPTVKQPTPVCNNPNALGVTRVV